MSNGYQFQECCGGDDGGDGHGAADDDGDLVVGDDVSSAQRVPEPDPLPGISFDTRPDPIQF